MTERTEASKGDNSQTNGRAKAEPIVPGQKGNKPNPKSVATMAEGDVKMAHNLTSLVLERTSDDDRRMSRHWNSGKSRSLCSKGMTILYNRSAGRKRGLRIDSVAKN
jgi:hypothetical protein